MIHGMLIGMAIGALFVLIRDIAVCFSRNIANFRVFVLPLYISYAALGGVIGIVVNFLWSLK